MASGESKQFDTVTFDTDQFGEVKQALEEFIQRLDADGMYADQAETSRSHMLDSAEISLSVGSYEASSDLYHALRYYDERHGTDLSSNLPESVVQELGDGPLRQCACGSWSGYSVETCRDCGNEFEEVW
ncbi:hypothetical protein DJ84_18240 [Halorubrum ezzemoulense]|nr:hypothetical protein DJ84_18240 [Halorubrum ezzemoulense]